MMFFNLNYIVNKLLRIQFFNVRIEMHIYVIMVAPVK